MAFETVNLANIYQAVDQSNANRLRNQMIQGQIEQQQQQVQSRNNLNNILRGSVGQDGRLDRRVALSRLYEADPLQAMQFEQQFATQDATANKERREQSKFDLEQRTGEADLQGKLIERGRNWFAQANNQAGWDAARQWLQANNLPVDQVPAEYSIENKRAQVTKADDWLKNNIPNYQQVDQGGKKTFVDTNPLTNPYIGSQSFERTLTPAEIESQRHNRATENIQNANLRISQAREAREGAAGGQKAPPGFRYTADGQSLEPIPGSDAAIKREQSEQKVSRAKEQLRGNASNVIRAGDKAIGLLDKFATTGVIGSIASMVPGSDRKALEGALETIKANLGFDSLQTMRDNSPTGGALGQVAVQELIALQSTVANLDPSQPVEVLRDNINQVMQRYRGIIRQTEAAQSPKAPKVGAIENGYVYTGGDPASPNSWKKAR